MENPALKCDAWTSAGLAYPRCKLVRVAGDRIAVAFLTPGAVHQAGGSNADFWCVPRA